METLGILDQIESLVSDKLEVVSYKWLSRNFLVSSDSAKRLLQDFSDKHKSDLEVIYALSGWLKDNPQTYHIRLVSGSKLEEAKNEFDRNCSIHVYSVQAAIPKDPAALWNGEFVQAEELFSQPSAFDNCLRDNRFCGILNPFVKRVEAGTTMSNAAPQLTCIPGPSKSISIHENIQVMPQQIKVEAGPKAAQQPTMMLKDVKSENNGAEDLPSKPAVHGQNPPPLPAYETKGQGDKSSNSLASLWGRASTKSKLTSEENKILMPNHTASAEAQISASEVLEEQSSEDEARDVNIKRTSNGEGKRRRRVVFECSDDEYEDIVILASPDLPKEKTSKFLLSEETNVNCQTDKLKVKEEKLIDREPNQVSKADSSVSCKMSNTRDFTKEKVHERSTICDEKAGRDTSTALQSPKRKKVLRMHIDERGREVNEVVWEGEETETNNTSSNATKNSDSGTTKKAENNAITSAVSNRAPAAKKSPAMGNAAPSNLGGKAANKKGTTKDPKQGNILSFFKRV